MHHEDIKAALRKQGVTQKALAEHLGFAANTVGCVIFGTLRNEAIAGAIAKLIGKTKEEIWPGVYGMVDPVARVKQLLKKAA